VSEALRIQLPPELIELIAKRAAEIVLDRLHAEATHNGAEPYLSVEAAALYLGYGRDDEGNIRRQAVDDLLSRKRLTRVKLGRRTLIERAEIEALLERQK
jgi:hypothetical protein